MSDVLLKKVNSPEDLKKLTKKELKIYASEARDLIKETVTRQGGHLASNLGCVELSVALHYAFNAPEDKILWDVGHQVYTHKLITGRREKFAKLRSGDGVSGFLNSDESPYDAFTMGHSSTSLSVALGMARARKIKNEYNHIVAVIGDGALTGGMAFEALNDIGDSQEKVIVILNDNKMSISHNVGAVSKQLEKLRLSRGYVRFKHNLKKGVSGLPFFGDRIVDALGRARDFTKRLIQKNQIFENMGIRYYGPFDGHNIQELIDTFNAVKSDSRPCLIHILTNKGMGDANALQNPQSYHGVSPENCGADLCFSDVAGKKLSELADSDDRVVAVTAAMGLGTGMHEFSMRHAGRYFDVGIAEQHAVTMAAGLAKSGLKPYFAVYSSFLQRAYDQILHDMCIQKLPVTLLIDRAGAVGGDGITHQGIFDISYLSAMPNMTVMTPKDGNELAAMLDFSLTFDSPLAIRYPKEYKIDFGAVDSVESGADPVKFGESETIRTDETSVHIICAGNRMLDIALKSEKGNIYNARFLKPVDYSLLDALDKKGNIIITMEDGVKNGGFGEAVLSYLNSKDNSFAKCVILAHNCGFTERYNVGEILGDSGLTENDLKKLVGSFIKN